MTTGTAVVEEVATVVDALVAMKARMRSGGTIAAYVWDYTTGFEFLRHFWDEAVAANPAAAELDEAGLELAALRPVSRLFSDKAFFLALVRA